MAAVRVGTPTTAYTGATSLTGAYPQVPTAGNMLIMGVECANYVSSATCTTPAGWTLVSTGGGSNNYRVNLFIFCKVAVGADAAPTVTITGGPPQTVMVIEEWSGLATTAYLDSISTYGTFANDAGVTGAVNVNSGPITTTNPTDLIWTFSGIYGDGGRTTIWGGGSVADALLSSPGPTAGASGYQLTSATGTFTPTLQWSASGASKVYGGSTASIAIKTGNVAPNAPTLTGPATGTTVDRAITQRFGWTFSDPNPGDTQSKFDLQYRVGAGAWTPITGTTPNNYWDAAPATFSAGSNEWQVRTYDSQGLVGPWSASSFFTAASAPSIPTITAPTSGSTVASTATFTWSEPTQTDYQLRRVGDIAGAPDTGTIYYDSGDVVDAATRSVTAVFSVNLRWEHIQVRVKYAGLWSTWADVRVYVSFTAPMVPTIVLTAIPATASITVAITNPAPTGGEPVVSYNDVFMSSPTDLEIRIATAVPPNSTWTWTRPGAVTVYTIRVVAVGSNGTTRSSV